MRAPVKFLALGNVLLLVGGVGWLAWQWRGQSALHREVAALRQEAVALTHLRGANRQLATQQISEETLTGLRADHEALVPLRAEVEKLKKEADQRVAQPVATNVDDSAPEGRLRPAGEWRETGTATPDAALETVLQAARGGQVKALAGLLQITGDGWKMIDEALKEIPIGQRKENWPPAQFVAAALVRDLKLDAFQVLTSQPRGPDAVALQVRLSTAPAEPRDVQIMLYRQPEGWRLIVPIDAVRLYVERYQAGQNKPGSPGK